MTTADWIKLLVPIFSNLFISGFVVTIILKKINDNFDKAKKREQYAYIVLMDVKKQLENIRNQIIYLQSGLIEDRAEGFIVLFKIGGDFQVFVEDYESYMIAASQKLGVEFFQVYKLQEFSKLLMKIGMSMGNQVELSNALDLARKVSKEIISHYNTILSEK